MAVLDKLDAVLECVGDIVRAQEWIATNPNASAHRKLGCILGALDASADLYAIILDKYDGPHVIESLVSPPARPAPCPPAPQQAPPTPISGSKRPKAH